MALAILSVYIIDFSVNVIQAMDRALLVDVIPPSLQSAANAWAGRMFGGGAVLGYMIGGVDLVRFTGGWLGGEQLKVVTLLTAFFLCVAHAVTVICVTERVLISKEDVTIYGEEKAGVSKALSEIWTTFRTLPRPIQQVLNVQVSQLLASSDLQLLITNTSPVCFLGRMVPNPLLFDDLGGGDLRSHQLWLFGFCCRAFGNPRICHSRWFSSHAIPLNRIFRHLHHPSSPHNVGFSRLERLWPPLRTTRDLVGHFRKIRSQASIELAFAAVDMDGVECSVFDTLAIDLVCFDGSRSFPDHHGSRVLLGCDELGALLHRTRCLPLSSTNLR